jgi:hypothetical protein
VARKDCIQLPYFICARNQDGITEINLYLGIKDCSIIILLINYNSCVNGVE